MSVPAGRGADPHAPVGGNAERARRDAQRRTLRRRRYTRGRGSEWLAVLLLMAKGYRILARRHKTRLGEIDIIARRGQRLAFVEVKARRSMADCEAAITPRSAQRIRRAADLWLAGQPAACDICFDVVFVVPRRWPRHIENGL